MWGKHRYTAILAAAKGGLPLDHRGSPGERQLETRLSRRPFLSETVSFFFYSGQIVVRST
jgi:hypothetical protein